MSHKKILFVYYQNIKQNGVSKSIANITKELVEKDYEVTLLFLMAEHADYFPIDSRVKKIYINSFDTRYFRFAGKLKEKSILKGKWNSATYYLYDLGCFFTLKNWINENYKNYDKIIACWYKLSIFLSFTRAASRTIAWEHTIHKTGGFLYFGLLRKRYKKLKKVVCLTGESLAFYQSKQVKACRISNIIGDQYENVPFDFEKKEDIILLVSRLDPEKNVKEFLEIVHEAGIPHNWTVIIAGTGSEEDQLKTYAKEAGLSGVKFFGAGTQEQMLDLYKKSKIFCMTPLLEGLPTTLIEAMFCGNVLISYDCPTGPSEIVNPKNGFLIPLHDKKIFIEKLTGLLSDKEYLKKMAMDSYKESSKWKKDTILPKWEALLENEDEGL
ncbi:MAG: glycosyltransferase family 4 protein [Bergeyella sp.]|nr:glycosyltransferase family 4 protein [Bergeyella sp.]